MKMKILVLQGLVLISLTVSGQQSEVRSLEKFTGVKSAEAVDVYLKKGDKESVRVEVTGTKLSEVITEVSGNYLKVHMRDGISFRGNSDVKAYVTYVELDRISASSASNIFSEGAIKTNSIELHASSAGNIEVSLEANTVQVHVSSAGDVILEGKSKSLEAEASSAGEVDAYNFLTETGKASASSGADIKLNVALALDAHASSGGSIRYRGNPTKTNTTSSSGGSVKRSN